MDHDWIAAEADQNCTFDLGRNEGVCTWVFLNPVPTVPPSSDPSAAVFATQTSTTVFTGSLVPIATVTAVSSAETGTTIRANILASVMAPFAIILLAVYAFSLSPGCLITVPRMKVLTMNFRKAGNGVHIVHLPLTLPLLSGIKI
ncbi:hypothetical protein CPC08DRAFT_709106, partial [Agrocybe pediades]